LVVDAQSAVEELSVASFTRRGANHRKRLPTRSPIGGSRLSDFRQRIGGEPPVWRMEIVPSPVLR